MTDKRIRLLLVTPHYPPDGGPSAPLFGMLCEELVRRGLVVTVIAATPHYPSGKVLKEYRGSFIRRREENGVRVLRIWVPSVDRTRLLQRAIQFICYQFGAVITGLGSRFDVSLFSNPGLEIWLPFAAVSVLRRKPAVFSVHDLYPDVGISLGIFRNRTVIMMVAALERFCLKHAKSVRILSESFKPSLEAMGTPESKFALIYDYVDTDLIKPLPRLNAFAEENGLIDKFIILYAGNIGLSQGLENVLTAAERLRSNQDLLFVFVGEGTGKAILVADAKRRNLNNVRFLPFQPRHRLSEVLASADVSLVVLKKGIGVQSLPSKILSILSSGRPVLASVDDQSATADLIKRSEAGICVPPEDPARLAEAILALKNNQKGREEFGRKGRSYAVIHHSVEAAAGRFERLLTAALENNHSQKHRSL